MDRNRTYLAFDLGATSWRASLGHETPRGIELEEIFRQKNEPSQQGQNSFWELPAIFEQIKEVLRKISHKGIDISSIGIDSWSVDYGLLDAADQLIELPRCYRDPRNQGMLNTLFKQIDANVLFERTGVMFEDITTLCQLLAAKDQTPDILRRAKTLLFIPDILRFWLTGVKATDFTLASTSQCFNLTDRQWDNHLLQKLELPYNLFPDVIHTPKVIGKLDAKIQNEVGLTSVPVVTGASHDTAAAFMTIPDEEESVIISSGTWSIIGVKLGRDKINVKIAPEYFGYEGNPNGTLRLIRNVPGMYLLEQCIRQWRQTDDDISYEMLLDEARACMNNRLKIDPFDKIFAAPKYMTEAIVKHCSDRKTMIPISRGQITYAILGGLAEAYHQTICKLSYLTGRSFNRVHIIGGGSKNNLLNELIAKKTGIETHCGYAEASCIGNILSQQQILAEYNRSKSSKTIHKPQTK